MSASIGASESNITKLDLATSIINYHIVQRQLASKTVEFSLSAFGTDASDNYLFNNGKGCRHVQQVFGMIKPTVADLSRIGQLRTGGATATASILDGLKVGFDSLERYNSGKKFNRLLLLLTDGEFLVSEAELEQINAIVMGMREKNYNLHVMMVISSVIEPTVAVSENAKLLSSMAAATEGGFAVVRDLSDSFYFFSNKPGMSTRPAQYKLGFYLSGTTKLRCVYWSKVMKSSLPSLKKQSPFYDPSDPESGGVKRITSYRNPDDPDEEVPFDEKIKGYRYGSQYVPVSATDEGALKLSSDPLMRLLGFIAEDKVSRQHFMESTMVKKYMKE